MTAVKRTAVDPKRPYEVRADIGTPMDGMHPDVISTGLPRNAFIWLENVRRVGSSLVNRGGQQVFADLGALYGAGSVIGLADLQVGFIRRLMAVGDGCPGISPTVGQHIASFATEQSPRYQRPIYKPTATHMRVVRFKRDGSEDGLIPPTNAFLFSVDNQLFTFRSIDFRYGTDPLAATLGTQETLVWTAPSAYSHISAMVQHGNVLLVAVVGTAAAGIGTSAIFRWDGLTWSRDVSGINPVTGFALYANLAVAGFAGAPNEIRVRSSAGAWSAVAPGAGTIVFPGDGRSDSYQNKLYIPSGEDIFSFDGTTLTRIPVGTTGVTAGASIATCKRAFGYLFANWSKSAVPENYLLRFDGSAWTPKHYDFFAQDATIREARPMEKYQGCLVMAVTTNTGFARVLRSQRRLTDQTWEFINTYAITSMGDISQMGLF